MDDNLKKAIRERDKKMGRKIPGNTPGRLPGELPTPGYIPDPTSPKPADPKFYKDRDNPRIKQIKKEE